MKITPRPHQVASIKRIREEVVKVRRREGANAPARIICSMPTGAGKTYLAAFMIHNALRKGLKCMFIVDRLELVKQTARTFNSIGIPFDVVQGASAWSKDAQVIIASAQTLERREITELPNLCFVDECHTVRKGTLEFVGGLPPNSVCIGLSATPFAPELATYWHCIVNVTTTDILIGNDTLTGLDPLVSVPVIDMSEAKGTGKGGDWSSGECEKAGSGIIGDIPKCWDAEVNRKFGKHVKTIAFVPSVKYGNWLAEKFRDAGITAHCVSYEDTTHERTAAISYFREGYTKVLISIEALCKGFDVPDVECIVDARPRKKSFEGFAQSVGRGMRSHPGKEICLLLDFAGNWPRFELELKTFYRQGIDVFGQFTASVRQKASDNPQARQNQMECASCERWHHRKHTECPHCGYENTECEWEFTEGKMVAMDGTGRVIERDIWPDLCLYCVQHYVGKEIAEDEVEVKATKYARALHKDIMGVWPKYGRDLEMPGDGQVNARVAAMVRLKKRKSYAKEKVRQKLGYTPSSWGETKSTRWVQP